MLNFGKNRQKMGFFRGRHFGRHHLFLGQNPPVSFDNFCLPQKPTHFIKK